MRSKASFCGTHATRSAENRSRLNPAGGLRPAWTEPPASHFVPHMQKRSPTQNRTFHLLFKADILTCYEHTLPMQVLPRSGRISACTACGVWLVPRQVTDRLRDTCMLCMADAARSPVIASFAVRRSRRYRCPRKGEKSSRSHRECHSELWSVD